MSLAQWDGGRLTVWASTQGIYNCRKDIAQDLKLPLSKVRVICQYMGGGFGNKNQGFDFDLMAALLARKTRRPVRVEFTRHEDFIAVHGRWATQQHYRIGYKKDGTLTAIHLKAYSNMGGYLRSGGSINGPQNYVVPNIHSESLPRPHQHQLAAPISARRPARREPLQSTPPWTILPAAGNGPGGVSAEECHQGLRLGKKPLSSNGLPECLRRGAETFGWTEKRRRIRAAVRPRPPRRRDGHRNLAARPRPQQRGD